MKKIYLPALLLMSVAVLACSKDFLKRYDKRIVGSWEISKINRIGLGGNTDNLPFKEGTFNFNNDGSLSYTNASGSTYEGNWEIEKTWDNNNEMCRSFRITAIDFTNEKVIGEYYDDIQFRSTNHFTANIRAGFNSYVTHFRR